MTLQTEFEFTLPQGYVDDEGTLHEEGRMRLATAADEIAPAQHPKVQSNGSYLTVVLLSRVVTELGDLETVDTDVIEDLFVTDLEYLQSMYERVNAGEGNVVETACPDCGHEFEADVTTGLATDGSESVESAVPGGEAESVAGQVPGSASGALAETPSAMDSESTSVDDTLGEAGDGGNPGR